MKNEEAIHFMKELMNILDDNYCLFERGRTAFEMSINALATQPEPLTDSEQRIFLAAMGREEKVCKNVDEMLPGPYKDSLVKTCKEIERKVKKALWKN